MDWNRIFDFVRRFAGELFLILCGAVLLLFPGSAVALVTKLAAWVLIAAGVAKTVKQLNQKSTDAAKWLWVAGCFLAGFFLLRNPLAISNLAGRVLGLFLVALGGQKLRGSACTSSKIFGGIILVAGAVLFLTPGALVNTLLGFAGLVLVFTGGINLAEKLWLRPPLEEGSDPNIIDADE